MRIGGKLSHGEEEKMDDLKAREDFKRKGHWERYR